MAVVFADQVSEMAILGTSGGRAVATVLHFMNDEAAKNDATMARDVLNNWQDHILNRCTSSYVVTGAVWRSLDRNDLNQGTLAPDPAKPTAGGQAGEALPPNVCWLVKKVTNNRQRGQRDGRMYLPGVNETVVNSAGAITIAYREAFQTDLDAFLDGVNDDAFGMGGGSGLVVLNAPPESRAPGTQEVDVGYRTVPQLVLDAVVATQRDRLR